MSDLPAFRATFEWGEWTDDPAYQRKFIPFRVKVSEDTEIIQTVDISYYELRALDTLELLPVLLERFKVALLSVAEQMGRVPLEFDNHITAPKLPMLPPRYAR